MDLIIEIHATPAATIAAAALIIIVAALLKLRRDRKNKRAEN